MTKIQQFRLLFLVSIFSFKAMAQPTNNGSHSIVVQGELIHGEAYPVLILSRTGFKESNINSIQVINNRFTFALPSSTAKGVYRLTYNTKEQKYFDFIINGEEQIGIVADLAPAGLIRFSNSPENEAWATLQNQLKIQGSKQHALTHFLTDFPEKEHPIVAEINRTIELENKLTKSINVSFAEKNTNLLVGKYIGAIARKATNIDPKASVKQIQDLVWQEVDLKDTTLYNTPYFADLITENLRNYMTVASKSNPELRAENLTKATEDMVTRTASNPRLKKGVIEKLTNVFLRSGDETPLQYLDEVIRADETCTEILPGMASPDAALQQRLLAYKAYKIGTPAPTIEFVEWNKKQKMNLQDIPSERVLLVFWSSGCPHCLQAMPRLNKDILGKKSVSVLAIAFESDPAVYSRAMEPFKNLLHYSDFKYWNSPIGKDYFVRSTPTYVLLDKDRKMVAKFNNYEAAMKALD